MSKSVLLLATVLLSGCAGTTTPHYDARFGDAVRQARLQMTINPAAGDITNPVAGIDGRAGRESVLLYQDSFKKPPPPVNVINIGGALGGGGGR